ncbi:TonB-dependent receptor [Aureispira anguillae]|uniref:TonB-dependent receptor n=1 Tax=Aureispira anguillae TaxID=2864201 RepID=A0A915YEL5_9BACT|nr:TonB-dependent receptor [Aureispira anguillae]BDS11629.1 TonB-dependent receptor [Aureispira anguillae]
MNSNFVQKYIILITFVIIPYFIKAQTGIIKGKVVEASNNQPVPFANVIIDGTSIGVVTDIDGNYKLTSLEPGLYNLSASFLGFKTAAKREIQVTNSKPANIDFLLEEDKENIKEVVVKASPFKQPADAPLSLQTIGTAEIQRNPGGNRDISKVVRSLPGVTSASSFRNDLLIRGGGPSENRFYLDDIEIPNINHFATQGSSGGPNGLINVDFIREVDFYSSAFPANRGNSMSSVFNFKQKNGRDDRLGFTATVGSSDLAATLEGPIGKKTTFLFSIRQSYLQFLFQALDLPFLPIYNDFQFKFRTRFDNKNEFYVVGLGACDRFKLNLNANKTEEQRYQLARLPVYFQWNYTLGAVYKHYMDKGVFTAVLSRSMLNNDIYKHLDNDESQKRIIDYTSQEAENKLRLEHKVNLPKGFILNYGFGYEYARYTNLTKINATNYQEIRTKLSLNKYGLFAQLSKKLISDRLVLSTGVRMDGNDYNQNMLNPLNQVSPRFSASFAILPGLTLNANTGLYYQLPSYTTLGYQEDGEFVNRDRLQYTRSFHVVGGLAYVTKSSTKFSLEAYYKLYDNYPFLLNEQVSLANFGADFGVIGDAPISSTGKGRTYGLELLVQQRLYKGFYGILAYTLGWSEYTDGEGQFIPSAWDSRHIVNLAVGKTFKIMNKDIRAKINAKRSAKGKAINTRTITTQTLDVGTNVRFQTGLPYTPYDEEQSALVSNWNRFRQGILDYDQLNSQRLGLNYSIDLRIDYKWFFPKWSLNLYLDLQNIPGVVTGTSSLILEEDADGNPQIQNPGMPNQSYQLKTIEASRGTVVPTLGIIVQY